MPGGDRTGPWGRGPMTGRATGYCAGYSVPGYMNPIPGRGWEQALAEGAVEAGAGGIGTGLLVFPVGRGSWLWLSRFWGLGLSYAPAPTPQAEAELLREQAELLKQALEDIQNRIESTLWKSRSIKQEE